MASAGAVRENASCSLVVPVIASSRLWLLLLLGPAPLGLPPSSEQPSPPSLFVFPSRRGPLEGAANVRSSFGEGWWGCSAGPEETLCTLLGGACPCCSVLSDVRDWRRRRRVFGMAAAEGEAAAASHLASYVAAKEGSVLRGGDSADGSDVNDVMPSLDTGWSTVEVRPSSDGGR